MYCKYCGTELPDNSTACTSCGKTLKKSNQRKAAPIDKKSKDSKLAMLLSLATVVLGLALISLRVGTGYQAQGLAAILVSIMALTGNRKLVPYLSVLELLLDALGIIAGIAAILSGGTGPVWVFLIGLSCDVLYTFALFKGEKGQPCPWKYLPVVIMVLCYCVFPVTATVNSKFLAVILSLIVGLPYAAYRYVMIRWMSSDSIQK